ncbi:MAG: hypothetical protein FWD01_02360, partial [Defluviitaleaceae bacterium]|nr:hypothetical protein [Defluviitaleaceae bacterium]
DIRITHILETRWASEDTVWTSYDTVIPEMLGEIADAFFHVTFFNYEDVHNNQLIAQILEFTGIDEENISFDYASEIAIWGEYPDFLLVNRAVAEFARPYFRLTEFAANINSQSVRAEDVVITKIQDHLHFIDIIEDANLPSDSFRFTVGLSSTEYLNNRELIINDILEFVGLDESDISFQYHDISFHIPNDDFLMANEGLRELVQQREYLNEFINLTFVRSIQQNYIIKSPIISAGLAAEGSDSYRFKVGFSEESFMNNQYLREVLTAFTGINGENIDFELLEPRRGVGVGNEAFNRLSPEMQADLIALEEYMEIVNAPFWQDRYAHNPVIALITISWDFPDNFVVFLYNPELLDLTEEEIAEHTAEFRNEIIAATGVENIIMTVRR